MTKDEFMTSTVNLQTFYNKKLNDVQLGFWFDELQVYDIDKYRRVVGEFIKSNKTFPALSEVLTKIKNLQEPREIKPIENAQKVKCNTCHGSGLVKYIKKENGLDYDYYCTCYCENGKRLDYPMLRKYEDVFYYRKPTKEEQEVKIPCIDFDISQINF